ncbi:ABC transporter substrate-binding protein [Aureliella helgolandensis]|uniref:NMT1/THI5 like protein n=1 Tax=Aureliella helgolandensis TaxID=2527968 RepID=A0A518G9X5_9BACT|nr:ABC transporter substrate-binding protein [Aureliella helgolandensis]QDV25397.1 NMT1/THI5 like protein [Aureliella helgolandensis]
MLSPPLPYTPQSQRTSPTARSRSIPYAHKPPLRLLWSRLLKLTVLNLCLVSWGCNSSAPIARQDDAGNDRVVLMLNWYPEAEHGGFYAAQVHGIFEQHGLNVEIRAGGPNTPVAQELVGGRVQFAIGNADDVLLFREQDAPIVALMAPIQTTPRCILVRASSPVKDLRSLGGMRLQANAGRPFLDYMKAEGLLQNVQVVPYPGTVANFVTDENTAIQAYSFSEPLLAEEEGVQVRKLMLSEIGFNPYASCLLSTESYIEQNHDTVRRMVLACREGWKKYLESPVETNAAILSNNKQGMTTEALEFGVQALRPLCLPNGLPADEVGMMSPNRWSELVDQFVQLKLISSGKVTAESAYTPIFLDRALTADQP